MKIRFSRQYHVPLQSSQGRLITGILVAATLLLCLSGLFRMYQYRQIEADLVPVTGRIDRIEVTRRGDDYDHDVYVSYTYRGREYSDIRLSWYSSVMDEGDFLELNIHPDDPAVPIPNDGLWILLAGGIALLINTGFWIAARWNRLKPRFGRKAVAPTG